MDMVETSARLIIARAESYLTKSGIKRSLAEYPTLMNAVSGLTDDALVGWAEVLDGKGQGPYEPHSPEERYLYALELLDRVPVLQTLMELCAASYMYPEFSLYLERNLGFGPCLYTASLIEETSSMSYDEIHRYILLAKKLLILDMKDEPLFYTPVKANERFMGFLAGSDDLDGRLSDFAALFRADSDLHDPFVNSGLIERGISRFRSKEKVLCLSGAGGRRFTARHIAKGLGRDFIFLNISDLVHIAKKDDMVSVREMLIREAYYCRSGICLYGFDDRFITGGTMDMEQGRRDVEALFGILLNPIANEDIPLIVCVDQIKMMPVRETVEGLTFLTLPSSYSYDDRKKLWQGLFDLHGLDLDAASFASRYRMTPKEASLAVQSYIRETKVPGFDPDATGITEEELFARINIESMKDTEAGVGRIIYPDVKLCDVKLKDNVKHVLLDAVNAVLSGPVVMDEWDLRKSYPYGRGVSLLMAGPPGTGKTMSANAIAGELSLPLYQVNLSNTVDKYIGETEKNLEKAFAFAEKNNVILFFDEADALFGTRSQVQDAKDRYANTEVSYLLQRMEAYDGIVLMATNIKGNMDPAFMRRIRFVAHFENPDEEMRRAIWLSCITDAVPHEDIDIDYLVTQFDKFTGSVIKTVFLNACVSAAGDGKKLSMKHLVYAIKQETEKESAVGFAMDILGKYSHLI